MKIFQRLHRQVSVLCGLLMLLVLPPDAVAKKVKVNRRPSKSVNRLKTIRVSAEALQREMHTYLGIPYRRGGESSKGMDCSGLVKHFYAANFDVVLPHKAARQYTLSDFDPVGNGAFQTGDLIFFATGRKPVSHVGIYLAAGRFVHASRSGGVTISRLNNRYWKSRKVGAKRLKGLALLPESDPAMEARAAFAALSAPPEGLAPEHWQTFLGSPLLGDSLPASSPDPLETSLARHP
jgi:hypothetical protein